MIFQTLTLARKMSLEFLNFYSYFLLAHDRAALSFSFDVSKTASCYNHNRWEFVQEKITILRNVFKILWKPPCQSPILTGLQVYRPQFSWKTPLEFFFFLKSLATAISEIPLRIFFCVKVVNRYNSANIYLFKFNNRNTRKRLKLCSKLTIKTLTSLWCFLCELWKYSHLFLLFLWLNLNR